MIFIDGATPRGCHLGRMGLAVSDRSSGGRLVGFRHHLTIFVSWGRDICHHASPKCCQWVTIFCQGLTIFGPGGHHFLSSGWTFFSKWLTIFCKVVEKKCIWSDTSPVILTFLKYTDIFLSKWLNFFCKVVEQF